MASKMLERKARGKVAKAGARALGSTSARATQRASKKKAGQRSAPAATRGLTKKKAAAKQPSSRSKPVPSTGGGRAPAARSSGSAAAQAGNAPEVGARAPGFELLDASGQRVSSADLAGQAYVLYFYPKDDTPGCTVEACDFRDALPAFDKMGVRVIGVSPDGAAAHRRFIDKYTLPFQLLSDEDHEVAKAYGVWSLKKNYGREYMGIVRSTFLVDRAGVIREVWRGVRVKGHADQVRAAATQLN